MKLYCPICKEVRYKQEGSASITIDGQKDNLELLKKSMKCRCGSSLVTEKEFVEK